MHHHRRWPPVRGEYTTLPIFCPERESTKQPSNMNSTMREYWIETRYFATSIGELTPEQRAWFYKWCSEEVEDFNKCFGKADEPEIIVCDYTQMWETINLKTYRGKIIKFWKAVKDYEELLDRLDFVVCTHVKIFPEDVIQNDFKAFIPADFVKKKRRYDKVRNNSSLLKDLEKEDRKWLLTFLGFAEAARENYEKPKTQGEPLLAEKNDNALIGGTTEQTASIRIDDISPAVTEKIAQAVQESIAQKSHVDNQPNDIPDFDKDGFWVSREFFASKTDYSKNTLRNYCESAKSIQWLNEECTLGRNKAGHFLKRDGNKSNSTYVFFLYHDEAKNSRFKNNKTKKS